MCQIITNDETINSKGYIGQNSLIKRLRTADDRLYKITEDFTMKKLTFNIVSQSRDVLFGLAIISIMIFHYCEDVMQFYTVKTGGMAWQFAYQFNQYVSSMGVEVFLLLSGMGLYFSLRKNNGVWQFYRRRLSRVLVPYLIWGALFWSIRDLWFKKMTLEETLWDYSLVTFWTEGNICLWYIAFILTAYLLTPFFFDLLRKENPHRLRNLLLLLVFILERGYLWKQTYPFLYDNIEIALWRLPIFVIGIYLGGKVYHKDKIRWQDILIVIAGLGLKYLQIYENQQLRNLAKLFSMRLVISWFSFAVVIILSIIITWIRIKPIEKVLTWAGHLSLELYMTHVTIRHLMKLSGLKTSSLSLYLICIALSIAFSINLHNAVEFLLGTGKKQTPVTIEASAAQELPKTI